MLPAILIVGFILLVAILGTYIIFKPPRNCCFLVGVRSGDNEVEINLQRANAFAGKGVPIVVVQGDCDVETKEICRLFCQEHGCKMLAMSEMPEVLKEYL